MRLRARRVDARHEARLGRRYAFAFGLMAVGPLALGTGVLIRESYLRTVELARQYNESQAERTAAEIDRALRSIEQRLQTLARLPWGSGADSVEARRRELRRFILGEPALTEARWHDPGTGRAMRLNRTEPDAMDGPVERRLPPEASGRADVVRYGDVWFDPRSGPVLNVAAVGSGGEIFEADLVLRQFGALLRLGASRDAQAWVIDDNGRLLIHSDVLIVMRNLVFPPADESKDGSAARSAVLPIELIRQQEAATGDERQGALMVSSYRPIPRVGWHVAYAQPLALALAPARGLAARGAAIALVSLCLAVVVGLYFARRLSRPVMMLRAGAERLGQGHLDEPIQVRSGDEIGALAETFNRMALQLRDYTAGLERLVAEKTRDLQLANEHKSAFLANVSHELRTPLNAVIGFSEALEEELFGKLNDKQREYVTDIKSSGLHLLALINDLLDLSKIEAGRMELERAVFPLAPVLDGALNLVRSRALQGSVRLSLQAPESIADFYGDARRLRQILLNLLSNAVKFTRPGGDVTLAVSDSADMLILSVTDTGIGIAPEEVSRLFAPFTQASSGGDAHAEGTGLGLALTKRLVELHGGAIEVASRPGAGSTFTVRLPRLREAAVGSVPA